MVIKTFAQEFYIEKQQWRQSCENSPGWRKPDRKFFDGQNLARSPLARTLLVLLALVGVLGPSTVQS